MIVTEDLTLDFVRLSSKSLVHAKQGDHNTRALRIHLTENGRPYSIPKDASILFRAAKPDGKMVCYPAAVQEQNLVCLTLTDQVLALPGETLADLQLIGPDGQLLATTDFIIHVQECPSGQPVESTNEILVFNQLVAKAESAAEFAADCAKNLPQTIHTELETAKRSGMFTGPKGDPGPQPPLDPTLHRAGFAADAAAVGTFLAQIAGSGAGAHNSIYRGKELGNAVTTEQYRQIQNGAFQDLYIGDYWKIDNVIYRIAAFDYYLHTGDPACTKHHVVLVPDSILDTAQMNQTPTGGYEADGNTTNGGYVGSDLYQTGLDRTRNIIRQAFPNHILFHHLYLSNAVSNGCVSACGWFQRDIDLLTEQMVYGSGIFSPVSTGSSIPVHNILECSQLPLFAFRHDLISCNSWYWLRDVLSPIYFAAVSTYGFADYFSTSFSIGIRPVFCIS